MCDRHHIHGDTVIITNSGSLVVPVFISVDQFSITNIQSKVMRPFRSKNNGCDPCLQSCSTGWFPPSLSGSDWEWQLNDWDLQIANLMLEALCLYTAVIGGLLMLSFCKIKTEMFLGLIQGKICTLSYPNLIKNLSCVLFMLYLATCCTSSSLK